MSIRLVVSAREQDSPVICKEMQAVTDVSNLIPDSVLIAWYVN